jgi:signal transduction histidine kinase
VGPEADAAGAPQGDLRDLAEQALRERRPVVAGAAPPATGEAAPPRSAICLPLVTPAGRPLGVLCLRGANQTPRVDAHDLDMLQLLAAQLAAAVESVQLNERLQQSLDALLAIHEAGRVLSASLEADGIGRELLGMVARVTGIDAAVLRLRNEREQLRVWQTRGPEALWRGAQAAPASQAARRAALATGEPRHFGLRPPPGQVAPLVGWCLPLRAQDRVVGVLEAYGPEGQASENTAEFLGSLATQAATALVNARLYRELAEREQQLADLVGRLLVAQEEERRRIAYNLHDELAQLAAGIHQRLQALAHDHRPATPQAREQLDHTVELARRMVREARGVIADLRPTALDDFGLATALRAPVEALCADGWEASYAETLGAERLPPAVETALFRVAQEALGNVRKHAGGSRVHVALLRQERTIRLEVQDWGRGFRLSAARAGAGPGERVGLLGMRERIALLGGRCLVRSRPGAGTRVVVEAPVPPLRRGTSDGEFDDPPSEKNGAGPARDRRRSRDVADRHAGHAGE